DRSTGLVCNKNGDYLCIRPEQHGDNANYSQYASTFALSDNFFSSLHGPSQPNYMYQIGAQGNMVSDQTVSSAVGCASIPGTVATILDAQGNFTNQFPCFEFPTIVDSLQAAGISW